MRKVRIFSESDYVIRKMFLDSFYVLLASEFSFAVMDLIDGLMTIHFLSEDIFAAQSLGRPFFRLLAIISGLLATGMQIYISKRIVKGRFREADNAFTLSVVLGLAVAVTVTAAIFLLPDAVTYVFGVNKADGQLFEDTKAYLRGLGIGSIPMILNVVLMPVLQINGDRARIKFTTTAIAVLNCSGNALVILVFDLGIFGIGLATSLARWFGLGIYVLHFFRKKNACRFRFRGLNTGALREILNLGMPKVTVRVCNALHSLMINRVVMLLGGALAVSAVGINGNIRELCRIFEIAAAVSVMLIAGTFCGERDRTSLIRLVRISLTYNMLINLSLTVIMFLFAPLLVSCYSAPGTQVHSMGVLCLRWTAVGMPFYAINEYYSNLMWGLGRYKPVHLFAVLEKLVCALLCAGVLGWLFGIAGVFASLTVTQICFALYILIFAWRENRGFPGTLAQLMLLSEDLGTEAQKTLELSVGSIEEVIGVSKKVQSFCRESGVDSRRAYFAALCTEELASNIVRHGFDRRKAQNLMIRVLYENDDLIIRFRDSSKMFDIREYYDSIDKSDVTRNIGTRMVMSIAKDVTYVNTMSVNTTIIKI